MTVSMSEVRERKQRVVDLFRDGGRKSIEQAAGLELLTGEASFQSADSLVVRMNDGALQIVRGKKIFINSGARPAFPQSDRAEFSADAGFNIDHGAGQNSQSFTDSGRWICKVGVWSDVSSLRQ